MAEWDVPQEDAAEQRAAATQPAAEPDGDESPMPRVRPPEDAPEADVVEQNQPVDLDEDEYPRTEPGDEGEAD